MTPLEFLKEFDRMCNDCFMCKDCPLLLPKIRYRDQTGITSLSCSAFMVKQPEFVTTAVTEWSKSHPRPAQNGKEG